MSAAAPDEILVVMAETARRANPEDAEELTRLRVVMFEGMRNLTGRRGYIANTCTDVGFRRRGYGRATITQLVEWMRAADVPVVDLHATPDGEPLYRSLGFTDPRAPALSLRL
jgi:ribosomal protein S18 acetylase RimI-like enzyme